MPTGIGMRGQLRHLLHDVPRLLPPHGWITATQKLDSYSVSDKQIFIVGPVTVGRVGNLKRRGARLAVEPVVVHLRQRRDALAPQAAALLMQREDAVYNGAFGTAYAVENHDLLLRASAETLLTIAADRKHLGARIGMTSVLHTWGSAMTHHPHVHIIVPGGGLSVDGEHWVACRPNFFLPVRVLSRLFRRLFLGMLMAAHAAGRLRFFGDHAGLADPDTFATHLAPLRRSEWVVYAKAPFGGPEAVLAYLSRYAIFQMAEAAVPQRVFAAILSMINALRGPPPSGALA